MRHFLLTIALLSTLPLRTSFADSTDFTVAFWNVENLFDTVDDPKVEKDEEFTPTASKKWTKERLEIKLSNLSRVIADMDGGKGPAILGLSEVENRKAVELLVTRLQQLNRDYGIVHQDSPSFRGIDCALIYDRKLFRLEESRFHSISGMKTRDVLEARLARNGKSLTVFVNHWPSRGNPESARLKVAGIVRARIDQILMKDRSADFLVVGDLNDAPSNKSVGSALRTWGNPDQLRPGVLFNAMWDHHKAGKGTHVYRGKWNTLDHVIASPGLLDSRGFSLVKGSAGVVQQDYQMYVPRNPDWIPVPSRSYTGDNFHANGFSDHLPVSCRVRLND